ncbi:hypothetical protein IW262DRAFT_1459431 [Armillaria fumosa]|nr:hypothetical protein IW262DRAFT_1459431 [Armillaria fumosa]
MWDMFRWCPIRKGMVIQSKDLLKQEIPDIWSEARKAVAQQEPWVYRACKFAQSLSENFVQYCEKIELNNNMLSGDIDELLGGNSNLRLTEFMVILKTTDTFAATAISTWPAIPRFPKALILDKRSIEFLSRLDNWPAQLCVLEESFNSRHKVGRPTPQSLNGLGDLGDKARVIKLLLHYEKHRKQEFWVGVASQVDGLAIYLRTHLLLNSNTADAPMPDPPKQSPPKRAQTKTDSSDTDSSDSDSSDSDSSESDSSYEPDGPSKPDGPGTPDGPGMPDVDKGGPDMPVVVKSDDFLKELYELMEEKGIAIGFLGKDSIKRKMSDWKVTFGGAIFISPLIIFCKARMGQVGTLVSMIKAGRRIDALGKPLTIRFLERQAWRCIIGVAAGMWDSETGIGQFLEATTLMFHCHHAEDDKNFFTEARNQLSAGEIPKATVRVERNHRWLEDSLRWWTDALEERDGRPAEGMYITKLRRRRSLDSVYKPSWEGIFNLDTTETTVFLEDRHPEDFGSHQRAGWRRGRRASILLPVTDEDTCYERCTEEELKSYQPEYMPPVLELGPMLEIAINKEGDLVLNSPVWDQWVNFEPHPNTGLEPSSSGVNETNEDVDPIPLLSFEDDNAPNESQLTPSESLFSFRLSADEKRRHEKMMTNVDNALEKRWRLELLRTPSWLPVESVTRAAKRRRDSSNEETPEKVPKLDPQEYERADEPLVFPDCYRPSIDKDVTLKVFGLKHTFDDDKNTITGYLACVAAGAKRTKSLDPEDAYATPMVARVSVKELTEEAGKLQTLLQTQHVYVTGVTTNLDWGWNLDCMKRIGNVDVIREVQDHSKSDNINADLHVFLSLREVLEHGKRGSRGLVVNALDLPIPEKPLEDVFFIQEVMSQSMAFNQTREMPMDIFENVYPKSSTTWALASTAASMTSIHTDCMGVGTVVHPMTGIKIWFLFRRRNTRLPNGNIKEFSADWGPGFIPDPDVWDAEMLVLEPGTTLFMRPNTHHSVVTIENCIISGQHFYVTSCIEDTVVGFIHTRLWQYIITNVLHHDLRPLLLRMMCYFSQVICSQDGRQSSDVHCPDISTRHGLLSVITLGNFAIFAMAINGGLMEPNKDGVLLAVNCYRKIVQFSSRDFVLYFSEGKTQMTTYEFAQKSAKHFAAALSIYVQRAAEALKDSDESHSILHFETFETGALTALNELFQETLTKEEIDFLQSQNDVRLLWKPPFIIQHRNKDFSKQLWDAEWEAMSHEDDPWSWTPSAVSPAKAVHEEGEVKAMDDA